MCHVNECMWADFLLGIKEERGGGGNDWSPTLIWSCAYHAPRTASENCYVIFGASIMVAYIRRDSVGLSLFLRDKVH